MYHCRLVHRVLKMRYSGKSTLNYRRWAVVICSSTSSWMRLRPDVINVHIQEHGASGVETLDTKRCFAWIFYRVPIATEPNLTSSSWWASATCSFWGTYWARNALELGIVCVHWFITVSSVCFKPSGFLAAQGLTTTHMDIWECIKRGWLLCAISIQRCGLLITLANICAPCACLFLYQLNCCIKLMDTPVMPFWYCGVPL